MYRGELLGFAGLVGSGRTETISALFGGYRDYTADVTIEGKKAHIRCEADAIDLGLNILTEDRKSNGLLLRNDIKFNIVLGNLKKILNNARLVSRKKERESSDAFMKKLRIKAPSSQTIVANLSGGNQQRVVLAKALYSSPRILLLDEPTKGIDVGSKQEIYEIMNDFGGGHFHHYGTSELPELLGMCDRFIVMRGAKWPVGGQSGSDTNAYESVLRVR